MKRSANPSTFSTNSKKSQKYEETQIKDIINLGIPHVGEQIFASLDTENLIYCLDVSQTWKVLAESIFCKRKDSFLIACKVGNLKILKLLLEHGNDQDDRLNAADNKGWTPFMWACRKGRIHIVKFLLNHFDLKIDLDDEMTACWLARHDRRNDILSTFSFLRKMTKVKDWSHVLLRKTCKGKREE